MATGERIRFFRTLRGMTQKYLGLMLGFPDNSADVRLAQYESEDRTPKAELTAQMADALDVSPKAIAVPDIDSMDGLMHTLFTLEDRKLIRILDVDGLICLRAEIFDGGTKAVNAKMYLSHIRKNTSEYLSHPTICPTIVTALLEGALKGGNNLGCLQGDSPIAVGRCDQPAGSGEAVRNFPEHREEILGR